MTHVAPLQVVVVSGLSGSGKSVALHALEDAGFYCVDNLPTALLAPFLELAEANEHVRRTAVAIDVRERSFTGSDASDEDWPRVFADLAGLDQRGGKTSVLFLDCDEDALVTRFKTSRRPHPLVAQGVAQTLGEAIARERTWVAPFRQEATVVIDTTTITVHDLRRRVTAIYGEAGAQGVVLHLCSFGFRNGIPPEADFVFDVRFLDNPYFVNNLRGLSGLDGEVARFVQDQPLAERMIAHVLEVLVDIMPAVQAEGRASLTLAIGCTGGRHRSVALIEEVRRRLAERGLTAQVLHRDIAR